jgi:hypothetical protein
MTQLFKESIFNFPKESIFNFPKEINALISTYLKDKEGDYFRDQTEDFIIKEIRGMENIWKWRFTFF